MSAWDPLFWQQSPLFEPVAPLARYFAAHADWPTLEDYQRFLARASTPIATDSGWPLRIVAHDSLSTTVDDHYEARIYLTGELPTRAANWHDFFQVLIWRLYPRTKAALNACHYAALQDRRAHDPPAKNRSAAENALTLFDECGVIIVADDPALLQCVRNFAWKELFWEARTRLPEHLHCIIFGHALYEKALHPYIGLTGHAILIDAAPQGLAVSTALQHADLDRQVAALFTANRLGLTPKDFAPFPLLGMPGWDKNNANEAYYDDTAYFRPGRRIAAKHS